MEKDNSNNYISLQEATKFCDYSQEYLSLRARQGKLKVLKFGRNWVTKKEWIEEYLQKVEEYNNNLNNKKETIAVPEKKFILPPERQRREKKKIYFLRPPKNLPIEKSPTLRFGFSFALVFVLLITGIVFGKASFQNVYNQASPLVHQSFVAVSEDLKDLNNQAAIAIDSFARAISNSKNQLPERSEGWRRDLSLRLADVGGLFKEYGQWIADNIKSSIFALRASADKQISKSKNNYLAVNDFIEGQLSWLGEKISQGYKAITQLWQVPGKIVEEKLLPKPSEEGLVVIPSTEKDEEVVKKIKESFSDEIKVEPKDETSGIIIPVFREREGEKYLYILVPVKN
jgi:hypothetical protein